MAIKIICLGVTLALNVKSKNEVDEVIELARKSGATIAKEPQDVFWGGYHAYFSDPDGYYFEVAWSPNFSSMKMICLFFKDFIGKL